MNMLLVMLGGALGAGLRYGCAQLVSAPLSTLLVNVLGCLIMGLLAGFGAHVDSLTPQLRLFLLVGVLGGFTTFSAFSLDVLLLVERGQLTSAAAYVGASVLLSIFAVFAGLWLVKALA